ncbi:hypothetical protein T492DRAFT_1135558 [Pavlovales sp. CCMP2436]|nr:hypothetical protein T492DRAFT_1135558 [Pavlovales sp. CCMP2436]
MLSSRGTLAWAQATDDRPTVGAAAHALSHVQNKTKCVNRLSRTCSAWCSLRALACDFHTSEDQEAEEKDRPSRRPLDPAILDISGDIFQLSFHQFSDGGQVGAHTTITVNKKRDDTLLETEQIKKKIIIITNKYRSCSACHCASAATPRATVSGGPESGI